MPRNSLLDRFEHVAELMRMDVWELATWLEGVAAAAFAPREPSRLDQREVALLHRMEIVDRKPIVAARRASLQAMEIYIGLVEHSYSQVEVCERTASTLDEVHDRIEDRSYYAFEVQGDVRLPAFQFGEHSQIRGLGEVFQCLPEDLDPLEVVGFLNNPAPELEAGQRWLSPLEWLRSGRSAAPVVAIAELLGVLG